MNRRSWMLLHRYAGLFTAFFLIVAALTGSFLAFYTEIDSWLNPPEPTIKIQKQSGEPLDAFSLREKALAFEPHAQINFLDFTRKADEAYFTDRLESLVDPKTNQSFHLDFISLKLNPYTGEIINKEPNLDKGLWPITSKNVMPLILALHYKLAIPGKIGVWVFGIVAVIWVVDCFVSVYLTLPVSLQRRRVNKTLLPRMSNHKSLLSLWKPSWLIRWSSSTYRINFDIHRAFGLWTWLVLFIFAWSSVGLNLRDEIYNPLMGHFFGKPADPYANIHKPSEPIYNPRIDWRHAHLIAKQLMLYQAKAKGFNVKYEQYLFYEPENGVYAYYAKGLFKDKSTTTDIALKFYADSGKLGGVAISNSSGLRSKIDYWLFNIHTARVCGMPMKVFVCFMGVVITILSITGVYIWLIKRRARQFGHSKYLKIALN